jgi:hypothetical protein
MFTLKDRYDLIVILYLLLYIGISYNLKDGEIFQYIGLYIFCLLLWYRVFFVHTFKMRYKDIREYIYGEAIEWRCFHLGEEICKIYCKGCTDEYWREIDYSIIFSKDSTLKKFKAFSSHYCTMGLLREELSRRLVDRRYKRAHNEVESRDQLRVILGCVLLFLTHLICIGTYLYNR